MAKYKATINIDRDVWDKFRTKCDHHKTTATAEITAFIKAFCLDREVERADWDEMPKSVATIKEDIIWEVLRLVEERFDQGLYNLNRDTKDETDNKTDKKTDEQTAIRTSAEADEEADSGGDRRQNTKTDEETDTKDYFSDAEVAAKEGLHSATVNRYRTGKRKMPVELATRWKICPHNQYKWISL